MAFHRLPQVIPAFCNRPGFGPPRTYSARFTLLMVRSPGFGSTERHSTPFRTRFRSGSTYSWLNLATPTNSLAHSTKGTPSPPKGGSDRPDAHGFRFSFTPLLGVLFTVPSRYWCTIGRRGYLALGRGRPRFPPDFACPAVLTLMTHPRHAPSPTGLSPSPVRCSNTARLKHVVKASGLLSAPVIAFNPTSAAAAASIR